MCHGEYRRGDSPLPDRGTAHSRAQSIGGDITNERASEYIAAADETLTEAIVNIRALFALLDKGSGPRLDRGPGAREAALCLTKLQEAGHWLDDVKLLTGYRPHNDDQGGVLSVR